MKFQNAKTMPFALVSPYPIPVRDATPVITDVQGLPGPLSARDNGVLRTTGSYVMRNRVAPDVGDLEEVDIQAWDLRVDGIDPVADATFIEFQAAPAVAAVNYLFNGTSFDRQASAGAASLSADPVVGAMLVTQPGEWTEFDAPAVNVAATATRAAGSIGERHVLKSFHFGLAAGATASGLPIIVIRDGLSGVGAILWEGVLKVPIGEFVQITMSGLNIIGSLGTAMTIEFGGSGGVGTFARVNMSGITVG